LVVSDVYFEAGASEAAGFAAAPDDPLSLLVSPAFVPAAPVPAPVPAPALSDGTVLLDGTAPPSSGFEFTGLSLPAEQPAINPITITAAAIPFTHLFNLFIRISPFGLGISTSPTLPSENDRSMSEMRPSR
jgi:hypothetical protein